jgi:hypothetical protein
MESQIDSSTMSFGNLPTVFGAVVEKMRDL